ncbi:FAD-binding oxidoreductase [Sutcliffiella halmapala]|uniref:FAD-binding oxidoreductase n=1 Tax=Sutcliffiella halmapala TaxID=79882 RepID=UPI000995CFCF
MMRSKRKKQTVLILGVALLLYSGIFSYSFYQNQTSDDLLIQDVSRLNPVKVQKIIQGEVEEGLQQAVREAGEKNLKISIAGTRHSQGGHSFYEDSLWLDMRSYNKILNFDEHAKTITVQSGTTWNQIQDYINPFGLSVKVMQSSNVFTVGGSLSSNVHGRDPNYGPIIETVQSFRLLQADGSILEVSRNENEELFHLVIGGYGLFGVILDVTIELTEDELYVSKTTKMNYQDYYTYFQKHIKGNNDIGLHFARLSVTPETLLDEMYMTTFEKLEEGDKDYPSSTELEELRTLKEEKNVQRDKFFLGLSRKYDWGKTLTWYLQKRIYGDGTEGEIVSRNNAMKPPIQFLDYESSRDTDILQEYFIPTENFASFVETLREIVQEEELNLLNVTVRYTPKHDEGMLRYSEEETFALVLYFNQKLSDKGKKHMEQATQRMVDAAIALDGKYYLTYQLYPTNDQIRAAYPKVNLFFEHKLKYDPDERFFNNFYERYAHNES